MLTCPICGLLNPPEAHFCADCHAPLLLQGRYEIVRELGSGGFGTVYEARRRELGTRYAIKEIKPDEHASPQQQHEAEEQFKVEANILASLEHASLPAVTDFFIENNRHYLVMQFIEGDTLDDRLNNQGGPLPVDQVVQWTEKLCDILTFLHGHKPSAIVHRDIKPSNIKLTPAGEIKLVDFGIAKFAGTKTRSGARAVSAPFSPIEQYGSGTDARSDIYALGVTAYQLLTNRLLPEAPDRGSVTIVRPSALNPQVPDWLDAVIVKAIAREATDRYQTAEEFKQALKRPLHVLVSSPQETTASPYIGVTTERLPEARPNLLPFFFIAVVLVGLGLTAANMFTSSAQLNAITFTLQSPTATLTRVPIPTASPSSTRTRLPASLVIPTFIPAATRTPRVISTAVPAPTRPFGIGVTDWRIHTADGRFFDNGDVVPFKQRFWFEFNLSNDTGTDLNVEELIVQVRAQDADYMWNLASSPNWPLAPGEGRGIVSDSLDLGYGRFLAQLQYRGVGLKGPDGNYYGFAFQVTR
ncbi:MAG: serine/threonine-protein kinase [Anaerolineae bacterium]